MDFRRQNGLTHRLFLVKMEKIVKDNMKSLCFHVIGTNNSVYKVTISIDKLSCSCPDHCFRKKICKHIHFVCEKVAKIKVDNLTINDIDYLENFILSKLGHLSPYEDVYEKFLDKDIINEIATENICRNSECIICLEDFDPTHTTSLTNCQNCNNSIHSVCWKNWISINPRNLCVFCRCKLTDKRVKLMDSGKDQLGNLKVNFIRF